MAKAKITITGEVGKFKVNEDGTVNVIIKADTSKGVPSGLKELGSSTYNIMVSQKMWKKVSDKLQGNRILFTGEPKAAVTVKGVPFTLVNCFDISVIEQKVKESQSEPKKAEPQKVEPPKPSEPVQPVKNEVPTKKPLEKTKTVLPKTPTKANYADDPETKALNHWRKNHTDVKEIKVSDLVLTEEEHFKGFNQGGFTFLKRHTIRKPIIVRPLDNGKFSLVVGFKDYIIAKILNFETVPALIADNTRQGIIKEALKEIKTMEDEAAVKITT